MKLTKLVKRYYKMLDRLHKSNPDIPEYQLVREVAKHVMPIDRRVLFRLVESNTWLAEVQLATPTDKPVEGIMHNLYCHLVQLGRDHLKRN